MVNYTIILIKGEIDGKNITQAKTLNIIHNILNIEGMDKVFSHIIYSIHNDAILKLIDIKLFNGTKYATFNDTFYSYKDPIIKTIYKILKEGLYTSKDEPNNNIALFILVLIRDYPHIARDLFNFTKLFINDNKEELKSYLEKANLSFLYNLTEEIFSLNNKFFDDLSTVIENKKELVNYTIDLVKRVIERNIDYNKFLEILYNIINIEGMDNVTNHIINSKHNGAILELIEAKFINGTNYVSLYGYFKEIIMKYKDKIIKFIYETNKSYNNKTKLAEIIKNFILDNNNTDLMNELRDKLKDEKARKEFSERVYFHGALGKIVKEELLANWKIFESFFKLINNSNIIEIFANIVVNRNNFKYIENLLPGWYKQIYEADKNFIKSLLDVFTNILKRIASNDSINIKFTEKIIDKFYKLFFERNATNITKYNINDDCVTSIKKIYFEKISNLNASYPDGIYNLHKMRYFFVKKAILDSTKNKNDFLTYENCLEEEFNDDLLNNSDFNFTLKPVYILGMIDDDNAKKNLNNSILSEQYDYWLGHCLPLPQKNKTNICEQNDYNGIFKIILEIAFNMENADINTISIVDKNFETKDKIYCAISFIIIFIPIIIQLFLYIYYSISYYKYKKRKIINQLTINQEEKMKKKNPFI